MPDPAMASQETNSSLDSLGANFLDITPSPSPRALGGKQITKFTQRGSSSSQSSMFGNRAGGKTDLGTFLAKPNPAVDNTRVNSNAKRVDQHHQQSTMPSPAVPKQVKRTLISDSSILPPAPSTTNVASHGAASHQNQHSFKQSGSALNSKTLGASVTTGATATATQGIHGGGAEEDEDELENDDEMQADKELTGQGDDSQMEMEMDGEIEYKEPLKPAPGRKRSLSTTSETGRAAVRPKKHVVAPEGLLAVSSSSFLSRHPASPTFDRSDTRLQLQPDSQNSFSHLSFRSPTPPRHHEGSPEPHFIQPQEEGAVSDGFVEDPEHAQPYEGFENLEDENYEEPSQQLLQQSHDTQQQQALEFGDVVADLPRDPLAPVSALFPGPNPHVQRAAARLAASKSESGTERNKWEGCTFEEWEQGGRDLVKEFEDLMLRVVAVMARKAARRAEIQKAFEAHRATLNEREEKMTKTTSNLTSWMKTLFGYGGGSSKSKK